MSYSKLIEQLKGGSGSGNFGHSGIPGKVGGSAPGGSVGSGGGESMSQLQFMRKMPKRGSLDIGSKIVEFEKLSKQSDPTVMPWQVSGDDYLYNFSSGNKNAKLLLITTREGQLSAVQIPGVRGEYLGSGALAKGLAYYGIK